MAVIRIKRRASGGSVGGPSSMQNAELAFNESDNTLYYGYGTGGLGGTASQALPIAGPGAFTTVSTTQTITGDKTFSGAIVFSGATVNLVASAVTIATRTTSDNSTFAASTAFVRSALATYVVNSISASIGSGATNTLSVSVSASTTAPAITIDLQSQASNRFLASPDGTAGTPTFRAMLASDIPTHTASKISDFNTQVRTNALNQMATPTASFSAGGFNITNLAEPSSTSDAATKSYVDTKSVGLKFKNPVALATTAGDGNISLSSSTTSIDSVLLSTLVAGTDRILVKNQTNAAENGVYLYTVGSWSRATDMDASDEFVGAYVFVTAGTLNQNSAYVCNNTSNPNVGSTSITFTLFSSSIQVGVTAPLSKSGNTISLDTVPVSKGGTGATTLTGYLLGSGQSAVTAVATISVATGGTGATTAGGARTNLGAAAAGANSDITQISGLITALTVAQGGTGATSASAARTSLGVAASGANTDITSIAGLLTPLSVLQGGTGATSLASITVGTATTAGSATTATTATNIAGGTVGQISYQSAAGTTGFITPGAAKTVLRSAGTSTQPVYESLNTLTISGGLTGTSYNGSADVTIAVDSSSTGTASKIVAYNSTSSFSANIITANVSLGNGTTTVAPLKFTSTASGITTAAAGNIEFINSVLYFTPSTTRRQLAFIDDTFTGIWNGTVIPTNKGGTGTNNSFAISVGGALTTGSTFSTTGAVTFSGPNAVTITNTGTTTVTLPLTGTLATLTGAETLTSKTITTSTITSSTITLAAGTTTVAPLTLTSGTNKTVPAAGSFEYDGSSLFFTPVSTRKTVAYLDSVLTGTWNGSLIGAAYGGTGVNNSFTITVGGAVNTSQAFTITGTGGITINATGGSSVTLPSSGTVLSDASTIDGGSF